MDRTYNVFIDNGLFVAANLLNKRIEEVSILDLQNNIGLFTDKIYEFITCNKYQKISNMIFFNSAYNNPSFSKNRKEKIREQLNIIINNIGDEEYCCLCGQKHIRVSLLEGDYLSKPSRAFIINCVSNTFYNHSNNLQIVNVCPSCIFLGMLSVLNMRKSGYVILYNSEDNKYMYYITQKRQEENLIDITNNINIKDDNTLDLQEEILDIIDERKHCNNLKVYKINDGKGQFYEENFLSKQDLELFYKIYIEDLLHEFNKKNLFYNMLEGNLKNVYLNKLIDFNKGDLKCSKELIMLLDKELTRLNKELNELIRDVCKNISKINNKDYLIQLKSVSNSYKFVELILKWQEEYESQTDRNLLKTQEEFDLIIDRRKYIDIKNKMIFQLILNR